MHNSNIITIPPSESAWTPIIVHHLDRIDDANTFEGAEQPAEPPADDVDEAAVDWAREDEEQPAEQQPAEQHNGHLHKLGGHDDKQYRNDDRTIVDASCVDARHKARTHDGRAFHFLSLDRNRLVSSFKKSNTFFRTKASALYA